MKIKYSSPNMGYSFGGEAKESFRWGAQRQFPDKEDFL